MFVDKNIKRDNHNKTIGLLIVKKKNKFVIEYTTSDDILVTTYALDNKQFKTQTIININHKI